MLYRRATTGEIVSIHRADYVTDAEYHRHIMELVTPADKVNINININIHDSVKSSPSTFSSLRAIANIVPLK